MIWWPMLILAFLAGLALGLLVAVAVMIHLKLQFDDARADRGDYRL